MECMHCSSNSVSSEIGSKAIWLMMDISFVSDG
jgi:hypothetical protein